MYILSRRAEPYTARSPEATTIWRKVAVNLTLGVEIIKSSIQVLPPLTGSAKIFARGKTSDQT